MNTKDVFLAGCAACAMFFGSGNIVLPLILGQNYPDAWFVCYVGFVIGGVVLPLIGLVAISMKNGSSKRYFEWLGPVGAFLIQIIILGLLGPFGIVPRCATVAFGGFKAISPDCPGYLFYAIFCLGIWLITSKKDQVMPIISKILTPIKLSMLIGAVVVCLFVATSTEIPYHNTDKLFAFNKSIMYGYQTMDLISAIYYGSLIVNYVTKTNAQFSKKDLLMFGLKSAAVAGVLLCVLYFGFLQLALAYHASIVGVSPDVLFITIAEAGLGHITAILVGLTIVTSCITTAIAIISSWTNFLMGYISEHFSITNENVVLIPSLLLTFAFASIGLNGILEFLEPILVYIYPVIILITCTNIYTELRSINKK